TYYRVSVSFFFHDPATTQIYTLSLHDALPILDLLRPAHHALEPRAAQAVDRERRHLVGDARLERHMPGAVQRIPTRCRRSRSTRSEEHTSELQSRGHLVCRLLLEKKKTTTRI